MKGVSLTESFKASDSRGAFLKILNYDDLSTVQDFELQEVFLTSSLKGTVRGMHLQIGSAANWRFIQVLRGKVFDVLLDLRDGEETYSQTQINVLSEEKPQTLVIPPGVAHGFQAVTDAEILYLSSHKHNAELDTGVNPFSIGVSWPLEVSALSLRDQELPDLVDYSR
jgi:dTDP-4-dehydrorhamnose 3,5-epimerase